MSQTPITIPESNLASIPKAPTPTPFQPSPLTIYLAPGVPADWKTALEGIQDVTLLPEAESANLVFSPVIDNVEQISLYKTKIVMAAAVPFFTVDDEISLDDLKSLWTDESASGKYQLLYVSERTQSILTDFWGECGPLVKVESETSFISSVEGMGTAVAILPFEEITPRWKILKINAISPLDKPFNERDYPLVMTYHLVDKMTASQDSNDVVSYISKILPLTNRDENKMTVVVMSGTTALTRGTAVKIQLRGTEYPIEMVRDWFLNADLRHVSNEIPFARDCPEPDAFTSSLRFCAQPEAIEVLEKLGVNVVELTGNHENDYGTENFTATLQMYQQKGWYTFGGGEDPETARKPLLIENNGNKIAFIGCNPVGPNNAWVKDGYPGVAKCDDEYLYPMISDLKAKGYVVISTFQHNEIYEFMYSELYREDFRNAVQAGSDIVQGSQAHYPMGFEFVGNSLIHYGLGNFLFDQMDYPVVGTKREFIDRHIIYNGEYINTELLTALLTDWSRPVPMNSSDREQFLSDIFTASLKRWP